MENEGYVEYHRESESVLIEQVSRIGTLFWRIVHNGCLPIWKIVRVAATLKAGSISGRRTAKDGEGPRELEGSSGLSEIVASADYVA